MWTMNGPAISAGAFVGPTAGERHHPSCREPAATHYISGMKRFLFAVLATILAVTAFAESLSDIFTRAKAEFSQGDYKRSLADIETLDTTSQKPGFENERPKLIAPISFYRAANLAALGRAEEAKEEFMNFLLYSPNTSIASPPFPRAVLDAFQKAQKGAAGRSTGIAATYATFAAPAGWTLAADAQWPASPVRYLLSSDQKKEYAALTTPAARVAFVANFWKAFDPTPETELNEFRLEFERRVAFADATFGSDKISGRETDRALIFAFLGSPTYAGTTELSADSDAMATLRSGRGTASPARGEAWYYRKGRVPTGVPFPDVRFDFITKEGYGKSVLQKEPNVLQALGQAADNARRYKSLN